eukprot:TRINITY_DN12504_c0_g1_i1.p1 TRINITY_DN12504_c0_g1~~TRINITY_DN12504_c0_g1_i1.p1  ORF type:complete len:201 (+),score=41.60 TRINITY_DN12504_c0_g1_i1:92-604(+)
MAGKLVGDPAKRGLKEAARYWPKDDQDKEIKDEDLNEEDEDESEDESGETAYKRARKARKERIHGAAESRASAMAEYMAAMEESRLDDFSNYDNNFDDCVRVGYVKSATKRAKWLEQVRDACERRNINLDINSVTPPNYEDGYAGLPGGLVANEKRLHQWPAGGVRMHGW